MIELRGPDKLDVRGLVRKLPDPVPPLSVLEGWTQGRVFVGDVSGPKAAFVWETKGNLFLAGQPGPNVIADLARLFAEAVVPKGQQMRRRMSYLAYWPDEWATHVPVMLACRPPIADTRLCYGMDATGPETLESLSRLIVPPEGCDLRAVDGDLLSSATIQNIGEVRSEILKQWNSLDDFLTKGAGYCLVDFDANDGKGAVTSWALSEYPAGDECSIGRPWSSIGGRGTAPWSLPRAPGDASRWAIDRCGTSG